jgi:hypothetical protein
MAPFAPMPRASDANGVAQIIRAFISPEEIVPGRTVDYGELSALASTLNRNEALHFLGFLNLLLSSATIETDFTNKIEPVRDVQTWLIREVISAKLLSSLQAKLRGESLLDRPLLHRTQLLFVTRLVATWGRPDGGNQLQTRDDFDVIGDLLFLTNGLFRVEVPASKEALRCGWHRARQRTRRRRSVSTRPEP